MATITVEGRANKEVKADSAILSIQLTVSGKDMSSVTESYNKFYDGLIETLKNTDNEVKIQSTALQVLSDEAKVKGMFGLAKEVKNKFALTYITVKYEDNPEVMNKVITYCENASFDELDRGGECLKYACNKSMVFSDKLTKSVRDTLIRMAIADADEKCKSVLCGYADLGETVDFASKTVTDVEVDPNGFSGGRRFGVAPVVMDCSAKVVNDITIEQGSKYSTFSATVNVRYTVNIKG